MRAAAAWDSRSIANPPAPLASRSCASEESEAAYAERSRKKDAEWEWVVDLDTMVELPVDLRRGRPGCTKEHCLDLSSTS